MVDVAGGEEVVGDVGADVGVADAPDGGGGHGGDLRDELLAEVAGGVGVALDVVLPAVPLPGGGPGDGGAGGGVEGRALRAGGRAAFAPEVVLHAVAALRVAFLFAAHVLWVGFGDRGEGEEQQRAAAGHGGVEHVGKPMRY